ncbi:oligopeptide/dipeptide ABC transporter atp-binding protein-like [Bordetella ansorpii]|uniref:Glutathione import ATP-binding protein GsiA n=1 Tax=Bordetella ansorpii TaxID=288768 RepID=A0A157SKH6_9BORD|nr:ABC transporter ATP-binding protein [Bordetella ansorpii]SAI70922.1 oligopeptide/dipeptide ABC transporter atp-binding protein-like [Bordetella ansorpii]
MVYATPASVAPPPRDGLAPLPDVGGPAQPLLSVRGLSKHFPLPSGAGRAVRAVDGVSFDVVKGETLGIVGESGCGKSTTSRLIMALTQPTAGELVFDGQPVGGIRGLSLKEYRRQVQMVFQDSYASLNPRLTIEDTIAYAPRVHGVRRRAALQTAHELLDAVGLSPVQYARRFPHELSGGQRQRVNIARALALRPRLLILDEPVSALDKSVEAQVLNLLADLKAQYGLTYMFISHDLNVVQYLADRVLVMYLGKVAEIGPVREIYERPAHPYTSALLSSRPSMDPDQRRTIAPLSGDPPNPIDPPPGCRFHTRCGYAEPVCSAREPALIPAGQSWHEVACLRADAASGHGQPAAFLARAA